VHVIFEGLGERGLGDTLLEKLAFGNWMRIIRVTIG
jgi:microsomal dipeptidase-like Zn-dependent dipeptidase